MLIKNWMPPRPARINDLQPYSLKNGVNRASPGIGLVEPAWARLCGERAAFSWPSAAAFRLVGLLGIFSATTVFAQIRTDASLGQAAQTLSGPAYRIPETLGKLAGNNLFHSFQTFSVRSGETASFSTVTPGIAHVISRVTGGEVSQINGKIQLNSVGATPDFYLINPAGVIFGADATLDVPASFMVGSAHSVKFSDGRFNADLNQSSTFSSAAPEAFGFLGSKAGAISVNYSHLAVQPGQQLLLAGGPLSISGGSYGGGSLSAPEGRISLLSVAGEGDLGLRESNALLQAPARFADLHIDGGAKIAANGTNGKIVIRAAHILVDDAILLAQNTGPQGGIEIHASGEVVLAASVLASQSSSAASAGSITLEAAQLSAYRASEINTGTYASGNAGKIVLQVGDLNLLEGSRLYNQAATKNSTGPAGETTIRASGTVLISGMSNDGNSSAILNNSFGGGNAGRIDLEAGHLTLSGGTLQTAATDIGQAGTIRLKVGDIQLDTQATLHAGSSGLGDAGVISVDATHLTLTQEAQINARSTGGGRGGTIRIQTATLDLSDGSAISNQPYNYARRAGEITVNAVESIRIQGRGEGFTSSPGSDEVSTGILSFTGNIVVNTPELTLLDSGGISSRTWNDLQAGNLTVNVDRLVLLKGGHLGTDAMGSSLYSGGGGNITVNARESILLSGVATAGVRDRPASIISGTRSNGGAGQITLSTPFLRVAENASINASTGVFGEGGAGGVAIQANAIELLSGGRILSSSSGYGGGGDIMVNAERLLLNQGSISAFGLSSGIAGRIGLQVGDLLLIGGLISTESGGKSKAGDIQIEARTLSLRDGSRITSDSSGSGDAGQIRINAKGPFIVANSTISTEAVAANGGAIGLHSGGVVTLANAQVTTSVVGDKGNGGDIAVKGEALVMNTGFIQANTAADYATGGKVGIDVNMLVASGNTLFVGGQQPLSFAANVFGLNVIQAAAPTGVSGSIQIARPALDLSGSLSGLHAPAMDSGGLGRSPCQTSDGSSLAAAGRGGLPPSARGLLRADPLPPVGNAEATPVRQNDNRRLLPLERDCL